VALEPDRPHDGGGDGLPCDSLAGQ
jgi:hypothetical protein